MRRRSFYLLAAVGGLALFTLPAWLPSTTGESWANDSTPATAKSDSAAGASGDQSVASLAAEPTHGTLHDRAFDKYVDSDFIAQAWNRLDADALTDVALQLAEGERILLRSHKVGSAADVLRLASRIATSRGNKDTLARITTAAKALKVEDVAAQVAAASKLGGASRADAPAATVQIDEVTPVQFAMYRDLVGAIRRASLRGDRKSLETAQQSVDKMVRLTEKQRTNLKQVFEEALKTPPAANAGDAVATKLSKLQGASRNDDEILNIVGRVIRAVDTVVNDDFGGGHGHSRGGRRGHGHTRGHNHGQGGTWTYYYDDEDDYDDEDEEWYDEEDEEWYDEEYEDEDEDWSGGGHGHGHGRGGRIGHGHGHGQGILSPRRAPSWLVGKWQVENRVPGAPKEVYTFASDFTYFKATTPNYYGARTTRSGPNVFAWVNGRLTLGSTSYTVASSGARMTLTTRGRTINLVRVN